MATYDYDLFVIGAGSGGVRAARIAGGYGARVAIAEERYLGGTCVNVGCIPKKLLAYAAHFHDDFDDAAGFGWTVGARSFDWGKLIANKDREIQRLNGVYDKLLEGTGAQRILARARLLDAHTVEAAGGTYSTRYVLVATGGWPNLPPVPGAELGITSNEAFHLERLPERVVIVGGGYIAVEFAGIFAGLGSQVGLVHRGSALLRGFDDDLRHGLGTAVQARGVDLHLQRMVSRVDRSGSSLVRVTLSDGTQLEVDQLLWAIGRSPNVADIGLESAGVALTPQGAVAVDEFSRTNVPNIYAVGDVTDRLNLTPMALAEGHAVAETLFNDNPTKANHENVATAVFSQPPIATVGLTEAAARQRYAEIDIYRSTFRPLKDTLSGRNERTLMKLVVDRASDRVLGCHMLGPDAAEIIQGLAIALKCGATKKQFDATIGIHPTAAEEFVTMRTKAA
ncbi:MAG TPA: glutathione-disulfide reductase [Candidatus Acidoferrales bacterium]|nr:glutathione-disulfide reductase [Candidatus Acidoferrales bacterium]